MSLRLTNLFLLLMAAGSCVSLTSLSAAQLEAAGQVSQVQPASANSALYPLDGIVVNAATGEPIRNALVSISQGGARSSLLTGSDGKFHFDVLGAGELGISVQKPGFFSEVEMGPGHLAVQPVQVGPDTPQVVLKLVPEGVIFGRITDAAGEPVEGVVAKAIYAEVIDGRRTMRQQFGAETNDDGEFRIFELRPGTYYLAAAQRNNVFYPYFTSDESATPTAPIVVGPGQHVQADFQLKPAASYQISGVVTGVPPGVRPNVDLTTSSFGSTSTLLLPLNRDGSFGQSVAAGHYSLSATAHAAEGELVANVALDVTSNVTGVRLTLAPAATIRVLSDFELTRKPKPEAPDVLVGAVVRLIPKDNSSANQGYRATIWPDVPPDQRFYEARAVEAGTYRVEMTPTGPWYVSAARRGGTDLLKQELVVDSGGEGEPIEITLHDDFAGVRGTVSSNGQPSPASVLLIPERAEQPAITILVDAAGHFQFDAVPPGDYTAFAFDRTVDLEYRNPEAMRPYVSGAQVVRLTAGGDATVNLQLQKRQEY